MKTVDVYVDGSVPAVDEALAIGADGLASKVQIPQYSRRAIFGIWAAAALPMGALAWLVAPGIANGLAGGGDVPMAKALFIVLTTGLVWQFVLVLALVYREQRTLRWATVRDALWLRAPRSLRTGRNGGRLWLVVLPLIAASATVGLLVPALPSPDNRDVGTFLNSDAAHNWLSGNWGWYALMLVLFIFNTVLGEELLFRGFLLPRMQGAFGRRDWIANGVLFAAYHLHAPWAIPATLFDTFLLAYPTKRYRSAWIGISVHSAQSVFFAVIVFALVVH